jgi:phosphatidylglycerophosphate synthase
MGGATPCKVRALKPKVKAITRIQQNLLARSERRLLNWLCQKMPAWIMPDHLTATALVGAALIFAGYAASTVGRYWLLLAAAGYFIHWFGDSLDGSLARYRDIERPRFGYFIDHSADALGILLIVVGIGLTPYVRLDVSLIGLAGYYLLSIHAFLAARVVGELKLSYVAAGPTELRLILVIMTLAMFASDRPAPLYGAFSIFDLVVGGAGMALIAIFIVQTGMMARRILREGE